MGMNGISWVCTYIYNTHTYTCLSINMYIYIYIYIVNIYLYKCTYMINKYIYIYTYYIYIYVIYTLIYTHKVGNPIIRLPFGDGVYYPKTIWIWGWFIILLLGLAHWAYGNIMDIPWYTVYNQQYDLGKS